MELSALRIVGLAIGIALLAFAVWRRRSLRNGDVLLLLISGIGLLVVSGTDLLDSTLSAFSFQRGNGGRILGLAVFAVIVLFLLTVRSLVQNGRIERKLSAALEGIAWDEFRNDGLMERFRDRVAVVVPAYNEEDNIGQVLPPSLRRFAGWRPQCWWSMTDRVTGRARSPAATALRSRATPPTSAAARRCAPATA